MFEAAAAGIADALLAPDDEWDTGTRAYDARVAGSGPGGGETQRWLAFDKAMFDTLYTPGPKL